MITISRDSGWADRMRSYQVLLDGEHIGDLKNGETKSFEVAAGPHLLRLKIDWCQTASVAFTAAEKDTYFECGSNLRGWRIWLASYYIVVKKDQYIWLKTVQR